MKFALSAFVFLLAAAAPTWAQASAAQPLTILIHRNGAETNRLPQYAPDAPVDVHVTETMPGRVDGVTVLATNPNGERFTYPLVRGSDGSFGGQITLGAEGSWTIALATRMGTLVTDAAPFTLDVFEPSPSNSGIVGLAVGAGIFFILGGGGFALLQWRARTRSEAPLGA